MERVVILKGPSVDETDEHVLTACLRLLFPDCKIDIQEGTHTTVIREVKQ